MLFVFRKLRKSFFQPGKMRTFVAYAMGEIVLIVVGILIAVEIDDRNQARKDHSEETQILLRLKSEFAENQSKLAEHKDEMNGIIGGLVPFLRAIKPDPDPVPDEMVHFGVAALLWNPEYKPNTAVYDSLIASAKMGLITNDTLNLKLNAWPATFEEYKAAGGDNRGGGWQSLGDYILDYYQWMNTGTITGFDIGPSQFPYDQKRLLSQPKLESWVDLKRANTLNVMTEINKLNEL